MAEIGNPFAYWPRWITARRLSAERRRDPAWVERMERAGFNLQLDEAAKSGERTT